MAKTSIQPDYVYEANGKKYPIFINKDGVTPEFVTILIAMDREQNSKEAAAEKHRDKLADYIPQDEDSVASLCNGDFLPDYTYAPETILFPEEKTPSAWETMVRRFEHLLTPDQREILYLKRMGLSEPEIAKRLSTPDRPVSHGAVKSRVRKIKARLLALNGQD